MTSECWSKAGRDGLMCTLCHGYLVDATTLVNCAHSFCAVCIAHHLSQSNKCPKEDCKNTLNKDVKSCMRRDTALQQLVYRLVPTLYKQETERRARAVDKGEEKAKNAFHKDFILGSRSVCDADEKISLVVEYVSNEQEIERHKADVEKRRVETARRLAEEKAEREQERREAEKRDTATLEPHEAENKIKERRQRARRVEAKIAEMEAEREEAEQAAAADTPTQFRRFFRCPASMPLKVLRRLMQTKLYLSDTYTLHFMTNKFMRVIDDERTLASVAVAGQWHRNRPLRIFFTLEKVDVVVEEEAPPVLDEEAMPELIREMPQMTPPTLAPPPAVRPPPQQPVMAMQHMMSPQQMLVPHGMLPAHLQHALHQAAMQQHMQQLHNSMRKRRKPSTPATKTTPPHAPPTLNVATPPARSPPVLAPVSAAVAKSPSVAVPLSVAAAAATPAPTCTPASTLAPSDADMKEPKLEPGLPSLVASDDAPKNAPAPPNAFSPPPALSAPPPLSPPPSLSTPEEAVALRMAVPVDEKPVIRKDEEKKEEKKKDEEKQEEKKEEKPVQAVAPQTPYKFTMTTSPLLSKRDEEKEKTEVDKLEKSLTFDVIAKQSGMNLGKVLAASFRRDPIQVDLASKRPRLV